VAGPLLGVAGGRPPGGGGWGLLFRPGAVVLLPVGGGVVVGWLWVEICIVDASILFVVVLVGWSCGYVCVG
jgi:hypothetical protein